VRLGLGARRRACCGVWSAKNTKGREKRESTTDRHTARLALQTPRERPSHPGEVLTLEETAAYLRLPQEIVEKEAARGQIPGRRIEDTWRFLNAAIDEWLRNQDSRMVLLQQAGAFANDITLADLRAMIYAERGRLETEEQMAS